MRPRVHNSARADPAGLRRLLAGWVLLLVVGAGTLEAKKHDIGGYRLYALQKGKVGPTVVFEAGMGDTHEVWQWIWPELVKSARVVLYDRAGLGRSDPGPLPRTSEQIVTELHALLATLETEGPYFLVGHSFGGLNVRLFANRYPDEVAGIVLVDATPLDYPTLEDSLRSAEERSRLQTAMSIGSESLRSERDSILDSVEEVRDAGELPDVPLIVVTSGRTSDSERFRKTWTALQEEMADHLSAERHIVTKSAGHRVHVDQPELVLDAILEVIELAAGWKR